MYQKIDAPSYLYQIFASLIRYKPSSLYFDVNRYFFSGFFNILRLNIENVVLDCPNFCKMGELSSQNYSLVYPWFRACLGAILQNV